MKTKDKILVESLRQFNEKGTDQVSIRSIARAIGISSGNLTYHFKNTDTIIYNLYLQLAEEMDGQVVQVQQKEISLIGILRQSEESFRILYKYKFLFLDFVRIARKIPALREHFRQLMKMRQLQFRMTIDDLIQQDILREEWVEGQYNHLILRIIIFSDSWIPDAEIHFDEAGENVIQFYSTLFISSIVPYLTPKGLEEYQKLVQERGGSPHLSYHSSSEKS